VQIADNVIKAKLEQVYWVSGTACSGKTTVARALAEKFELGLYNADEMYAQHMTMASPEYQPSMCRQFPDLRSWFCQPLDEYSKGLDTNLREALDMVIIDAICLSRERPLVVEGSFSPKWLQHIAPSQRFAFMYARPELVRRDFFAREDKQDVLAAINALPDGERVREHVLNVVEHSARQWIETALQCGVQMFERTDHVAVAERVTLLARHFGLKG
jgi:hypothetical protein